MDPSDEPGVLPGVVRQIGYVVRDLDEAVAGWLQLGVGPWFVLRDLEQRALYRGQPCSITMSVAFANSGDMQVELIHQQDDTPSIYTEFLESGREGFHQLAWWASDFEAAVRNAERAGWPVVWSGAEDEATRYAYLEAPGGPAAIVEIMELNDLTEGMATLVRDAAAGWNGDEPIRSLL